MAAEQYEYLLEQMPRIAEAIHIFKSEAVQTSAFNSLVTALGTGIGDPNALSYPESQKKGADKGKNGMPEAENLDQATFFEAHEHTKPSENVKLIVAWLYSQYGVYPITNSEIQDVANKAGITVGGRADMSMKVAKKDGKALFTKQGKGVKLTLAGESFLKEKYGVRKGNKLREEKETQ